jgi:hypothetical protein
MWLTRRPPSVHDRRPKWSPRLAGSTVVIALLPFLLASCGSSQVGGSTTTQFECPPVPVWDRYVAPQAGERSDSPEDAVLEFTSGLGRPVTITSSHPSESGDEVIVKVTEDATDETGEYRVIHQSGAWSVAGGEGCGAPGPDTAETTPTECIAATPLNEGDVLQCQYTTP